MHQLSTISLISFFPILFVYQGGLSWQTTEETLRYHFEQYGEVSAVEVMRDRNTGDPRGFAFVVFKSDETVDLILKNKPHEINHKVVDVKRAQARGVAPPSIHPRGAEVSFLCIVGVMYKILLMHHNIYYFVIHKCKSDCFNRERNLHVSKKKNIVVITAQVQKN